MMGTTPTVKILVGYHKPAPLFKSDILVPIHCGRDCALEPSKDGKLDRLDLNWLLNNTIGDNTGDNISNLNRYLNEMTAIYWGWKNYEQLGNPDYIGFMQYGKHLILNPYMEIMRDEWLQGVKAYLYNIDYYQSMHNLSEGHILSLLRKWDLLCPYKVDVRELRFQPKNIRARIAEMTGNDVEAFDLMEQIIKRSHPNFSPYVDEIVTGSKHYPLNTFIMKRDLFFEYCKFSFDVLLEMTNRMDFSERTIFQKRTPALVSELVTSIFISSIEGKCKAKECYVAAPCPLGSKIPYSRTPVNRQSSPPAPSASPPLSDLINYNRFRFMYIKLYVLSKLLFGRKRKEYKQKRKLLKKRINTIRQFWEF